MTLMDFRSAPPLLKGPTLCDELADVEKRLSRGHTNLEALRKLMDEDDRLLRQWANVLAAPSSTSTHAHACRTRSLNARLCEDSNATFGGSQPPRQHASTTWEAWMAELWLHETSVADCLRFEQFHALDWNPRLFGWTSFQNPSRLWADYMRLRLSPADAKIVDAAAARPFGPVTWPLFNCSNGLQCWRDPADGNATQSLTLRAESVLMATNLDILQRSTGLDLRSLSLLVEFGGGTGQLALVAKAAGMRDALHVVYDLTPMGLSQRYWLRRAGLGAYLVPSEWPYSLLAGVGSGAPGSSLAAGRVALVSSTSPEVNQELLPRLLRGVGDSASVDAAAGGGSLFVATWSFSESSLSAREAIRPLLGSFDRLLIRFRDSFASATLARRSRPRARAADGTRAQAVGRRSAPWTITSASS